MTADYWASKGCTIEIVGTCIVLYDLIIPKAREYGYVLICLRIHKQVSSINEHPPCKEEPRRLDPRHEYVNALIILFLPLYKLTPGAMFIPLKLSILYVLKQARKLFGLYA